MNHPNREEWISFIYEEIDPTEKTRLNAHLQTCAACQAQMKTFRGAMNALDTYQVAATPPRRQRHWISWAAAAALFLAIGVAIGSRTTAASPDVTALQQRLQKAETQNLQTQKLLADLAETMAENRALDQAALFSIARTVETTRKDLETVAAATQNQFVRLASYQP